jgi:zinc-ribbon domain
MTCSKCSRQNPEGARFCNSCGAPLVSKPASSWSGDLCGFTLAILAVVAFVVILLMLTRFAPPPEQVAGPAKEPVAPASEPTAAPAPAQPFEITSLRCFVSRSGDASLYYQVYVRGRELANAPGLSIIDDNFAAPDGTVFSSSVIYVPDNVAIGQKFEANDSAIRDLSNSATTMEDALKLAHTVLKNKNGGTVTLTTNAYGITSAVCNWKRP